MSITIEIPVSLIKKLSKAAHAFHELEDELEDFFSSLIQSFLQRCVAPENIIRQAKPDHLVS